MNTIKIENLTDQQRQALNIPDQPKGQGPWGVWECEPASFDWHYDSVEKAYVYEGTVTVKTADGDVKISAGDFVTFPSGLDCTWIVHETIRKVYMFE